MRAEAVQGEVLAGGLDRGVGQVDAVAARARPGELEVIAPGADADLEDLLAGEAGELRDREDVRLLGIAVLLDLREPLGRAERRRADDPWTRPARFRFPVGADGRVQTHGPLPF